MDTSKFICGGSPEIHLFGSLWKL